MDKRVKAQDRTTRGTWFAAAGLFLLVCAVYMAASPGRIDIIDGQYRFDVARNLYQHHSMKLTDHNLPGVPGYDGFYSPYGLAGSLTPLPMLALADLSTRTTSVERQQFFFTLTSPVFGAATAALLLIFYEALGVPRSRAVGCALVAAFATLTFPTATSVVDQVQHGFFALAALYFAFLAERYDSSALAWAAGAMLAALVNFQESYALLIPTIAIAALGPRGVRDARSVERWVFVVAAASVGLLVWAGINSLRFASPLMTGKGLNHPYPFGNPLIGAAGLLFSPGKSIILYSPLTLLAPWSVRRLRAACPSLGLAITAASVAYFCLIASLSFYGGDWCWGPRYFAVVLPLVALGLPFLPWETLRFRWLFHALAVGGVLIQLLALSVDMHRFFYERRLPPFFWATDNTFYYRQSALAARPGELWSVITDPPTDDAMAFRPGPHQELLTYAIFGPKSTVDTRNWMRGYRVFWLPRPWPLWMSHVPPDARPVPLGRSLAVLAALAATGVALLLKALDRR